MSWAGVTGASPGLTKAPISGLQPVTAEDRPGAAIPIYEARRGPGPCPGALNLQRRGEERQV